MASGLKTIGLLREEDYPEEQRTLVADFNRKLIELSGDKYTLTQTISKQEQLRQTVITGQTRVYNINLSLNMIEDEIFEYIDGEQRAVFEYMGLPCPCPLDIFLPKIIDFRKLDKTNADRFERHFDRERLLNAFSAGIYEHVLNYEATQDDGCVHIIHHTILLTSERDHGHIIAMCSAKDITAQAAIDKELTEAKDTIKQDMRVYEALTREYHTIFLINPIDHTMKLFRSTSGDGITEQLILSRAEMVYEDIMSEYVDRCSLPGERDKMKQAVDFTTMAKAVEETDFYTISYDRLDIDGNVSSRRMTFSFFGDDPISGRYVLAFKNPDVNSIEL